MTKNKNLFLSYLSLFTSVGTVLCCALPSLLVVLGMGAGLAGLISYVPQLVWISEYKGAVFTLSAVLLISAGAFTYLRRNDPCPLDPDSARACAASKRWSVRILSFSVALWISGFVFAFVLPRFAF